MRDTDLTTHMTDMSAVCLSINIKFKRPISLILNNDYTSMEEYKKKCIYLSLF